MEDGIGIRDRVEQRGNPTMKGLVVDITSSGRVVVLWDNGGSPTPWNIRMLKKIPKPALSTFCGYCLENFRLRPGTRDATDDVVTNSRNGVTFHMACARAIAHTLADIDNGQALIVDRVAPLNSKDGEYIR